MEYLQAEILLHWAAVIIYAVAAVTYSISTIFDKKSFFKWATGFTVFGLIPHSIAILLRWKVAGHGPYMMRYEVLSSNAWIFIVMYLVLALRIQKLRCAGMIVLPYSFLTMTYGLFSNPAIKQVPPSLSSVWLVLHVLFYKLAVGAILISFATAIFLLSKGKINSKLYAKFPDSDALDYYSYRFASFGFTFWSIGLLAGSIWANLSWGRYWGWDPIETWSFITWLYYGFYLHMRFFFKWQGKKAAWLVIGCFVLSFISAFVVPFVAPISIHDSYFT